MHSSSLRDFSDSYLYTVMITTFLGEKLGIFFGGRGRVSTPQIPYIEPWSLKKSSPKAIPWSSVMCRYCVAPSFQADLTGAVRALKKGNKTTRERTRVITKAATVKRRPVNRFVSFSVCFASFAIKGLCSLPHVCLVINSSSSLTWTGCS